MLDHTDQDEALGKALRDADYASLTRRAVTDNGRALVGEVLRLIAVTEAETRKRQRGASRADAFRQAVEGFLGDLLAATDGGWVYRSTGHSRSISHSRVTDALVSDRNFAAARRGLQKLGLLKEVPGVQGFGTPATRFKATPLLEQLAAQYGVQPSEVDRHFVLPLPTRPLLLKSNSRWMWGNKIDGEVMEIDYTDEVRAMEQVIKDLNSFLDQFDIRGGSHRGYIRQFECGDHPKFEWNLGGRLYSQSTYNYQQISSAERPGMTIDGKRVCEVDVKASALTIFHAQAGQPLDLTNDPYTLRELNVTTPRDRDVVKTFINTTFGSGQFPARWPKEFAEEYEAENGQRLGKRYPIRRMRDAVARAYPLLAELQRDKAQPPIWATLQYLESEAVLKTMLALQAAGIPSLSVHDSLIVQRESKQIATDILMELYKATTGATPCIVTKSCNPDTAEQP